MIAGALYHELYGFRHRPFALTPDPGFLYLGENHQDAIDLLVWGIEEGLGFLALTGEVGTGKTTLVHALLARLPERFRTAYVLNPVLSFPEILATVLEDLGVRPGSTRKADLLAELNRFLLAEHAEGREVLLVVDEAHNLTAALLEELRMLSNLETDTAKLIQLVLVGQPELDALLDLPQLRQLAQRVGVRIRLRPLTRTETGVYIEHRLRVAGGAHACRFTPGAAARVFAHTGGLPRMINKVCHAALVAGYVAGAPVITEEMVERGWRELVAREGPAGATPAAPPGRRRLRWLAEAAAILLFAGMVGLALAVGHAGLP